MVECLAQDGFHPSNLDIQPPASLSKNEIHVAADLLDTEALLSCLRRLQSEYAITRLVNNAGMIQPASLEDTDIETMRRVTQLNLETPLLIAQHLLPAMKAAGFGRIVTISSRAALGKELRSAYAATKAGLLGVTRTWTQEARKRVGEGT